MCTLFDALYFLNSREKWRSSSHTRPAEFELFYALKSECQFLLAAVSVYPILRKPINSQNDIETHHSKNC
jgi:hypothetical protein